ncbi:hypothetical protein T05_7874 [Trichinella murrelli]|uniref:Uncharacterized protein n=1 Tax=Trichinella murrelli TaxID=144512 RepID=A0A0V0T1S1_9BILA|nr:hypothetical protein T05_7874 [Trichinella murrelli]
MQKTFPIPKFNHPRAVSREFQMGCFPVYYDRRMQNLNAVYSTSSVNHYKPGRKSYKRIFAEILQKCCKMMRF